MELRDDGIEIDIDEARKQIDAMRGQINHHEVHTRELTEYCQAQRIRLVYFLERAAEVIQEVAPQHTFLAVLRTELEGM